MSRYLFTKDVYINKKIATAVNHFILKKVHINYFMCYNVLKLNIIKRWSY